MEMYIGDDVLCQQMERMDKLSEIRLKLGAYQYMENLRNEVLADSLFRTEEKMEIQQEQPMADKTQRIIAKIQAELLKRILPSNRNSVMAVKWMKIIKENHQKMVHVREELSRKLQQYDGDSFEEISRDLGEKNQDGTLSKKKEEKQSEPVTDRRKILINNIQVDLLRTMLPIERNSRMAVKYMGIIRENHVMLMTIQEELLKKVKEREDDSIADSFRKLENVNQIKWNATLDAWDKDKRNKILFSILVDQVKRIRTRRCPQMAGKMMKRLQDRHIVLKNLQVELVRWVNERANLLQRKKTVEEELLMVIKTKEELKKRRKMLQIELMSYHRESAVDEDTLFVPRKLFLNSVQTFKAVPKLENAPRVAIDRKDGPSVSLTYEDQPQSQLKKGAKPTLMSRIKRIFGFR
eukprot:XP_011419885.2 PREDICTED: uncharacterized protein LOC105322724 [Crassostrea gigas]